MRRRVHPRAGLKTGAGLQGIVTTAPTRCPECGSSRIAWDETRRESICQACGLVIEPEGDEMDPGQVPTETTAPTQQDDRLPSNLERAQRLADERSSSERRLIHVRQETRRLAAQLDCPRDIADRAGDLFEQARRAGITQGRSLDALAAASLMASCRMMHLVRTEEDIEAAARATWEEIKHAYRALVRELELPVPPMTAHEYMGQLATDLDVPGPLEATARDILQQVCGTVEAAGKDPLGWAAAALVRACQQAGEDLSMNRAAQAAGVSPTTVKARLADLDDLDL